MSGRKRLERALAATHRRMDRASNYQDPPTPWWLHLAATAMRLERRLDHELADAERRSVAKLAMAEALRDADDFMVINGDDSGGEP